MERLAHSTIRRRRFSPQRLAAISGTVVLEAAAIYAIATGLTIRDIHFIPRTVVVDFYKSSPPPVRPPELPRLTLIEPPITIVPPPDIQIQTSKPPPRVMVARMRPYRVAMAPVQTVGPPLVVRVAAPARQPGITAPVSIDASHSCERAYPSIAVRLNQQGTTTVRFTVNTDGSVSGVHVAKSSGHEMLDDAAIRCAFSWRYRPAFEDGRPVPAAWTTNVLWTLKNGSIHASTGSRPSTGSGPLAGSG